VCVRVKRKLEDIIIMHFNDLKIFLFIIVNSRAVSGAHS
jgi:hypothetical protein